MDSVMWWPKYPDVHLLLGHRFILKKKWELYFYERTTQRTQYHSETDECLIALSRTVFLPRVYILVTK